MHIWLVSASRTRAVRFERAVKPDRSLPPVRTSAAFCTTDLQSQRISCSEPSSVTMSLPPRAMGHRPRCCARQEPPQLPGSSATVSRCSSWTRSETPSCKPSPTWLVEDHARELRQLGYIPPLMWKVCPVMKPFETTVNTTSATSSAVPQRLTGTISSGFARGLVLSISV